MKSAWSIAGSNAWRNALSLNGGCEAFSRMRSAHPVRIQQVDDDVLVGREQRAQFRRRLFPPVDLALLQGRRRGRGVGDDPPFDAIEEHTLRPGGQADGAIGPRLIGCVTLIDDQTAGVELLLIEPERSRTGGVADLLERVGGGDALRHHEGRVGDRGQRVEQQREWLLQAEAQAGIVEGGRVRR